MANIGNQEEFIGTSIFPSGRDILESFSRYARDEKKYLDPNSLSYKWYNIVEKICGSKKPELDKRSDYLNSIARRSMDFSKKDRLGGKIMHIDDVLEWASQDDEMISMLSTVDCDLNDLKEYISDNEHSLTVGDNYQVIFDTNNPQNIPSNPSL